MVTFDLCHFWTDLETKQPFGSRSNGMYSTKHVVWCDFQSIYYRHSRSSIIHWIYICSPSENDKCLKKGEVNENNSEIHQKPQNFIPCKSICILYVTFNVSWNVRLFAKYFNSFLVCPKCANRFLVISNGVRYCVIN